MMRISDALALAFVLVALSGSVVAFGLFSFFLFRAVFPSRKPSQ